MATPYAYEPVHPLHWSIDPLYNPIPFSGTMDSYDYFSATANFPPKSCPPHFIQPQPQTQYFQPPATQEVNLFDVNAMAVLSPSSFGSLTITTNRGVRRRRQQEVEEPAEEFLPAPKRRRYEPSNSSVTLPSVPTVPGDPSDNPAGTAQPCDMDISIRDEQTTPWAPSVRKRRSLKRRTEDVPSTSSSTREPASLSVIRGSSASLPDTKYGWLDHLLGSALEGNKRP